MTSKGLIRLMTAGGCILLAILVAVVFLRTTPPERPAPSSDSATAKPVGTPEAVSIPAVPVRPVSDESVAAPVVPSAPVPAPAIAQASSEAASVSGSLNLPADGAGLILEGRITDSDGTPLEGARVSLASTHRFRTTLLGEGRSDAKGRYQVAGRDQLSACATVSLDGFAPAVESISGAPLLPNATGVRRLRRDFVLRRGAPVSGRVVDARDQPVEGALVVALADSATNFTRHTAAPVEVRSASDGTFALKETPPGDVYLVALKDGLAPVTRTVSAPATDVLLRLDSGAAQGVIEGAVFNKTTGAGVSGAEVSVSCDVEATVNSDAWVWVPTSVGPIQLGLGGSFLAAAARVTTDGSGLFRFSGLSAATYTVTAEKDGLFTFRGKVARPVCVNLGVGERRSGIELFLYEGHRIHGRVLDKRTGEPIEGVEVSLGGSGMRLMRDRSGADGAYSLHLSGSTVFLQAKKPGFRPAEGNRPGKPLHIILAPSVLEVKKDIEMLPSVSVSGRVYHSGGAPASDAEIAVDGANILFGQYLNTPANSDGTFTVEVAPLSSFVLVARAPGEALLVSDSLSVQDAPLTDIELRFQPSCSAEGEVADDAGQPVADAVIEAWFWFGIGGYNKDVMPFDLGVSGVDGRFRGDLLPAGTVDLWARKSGYADSPRQKLTLAPGETKSDLKLVLASALYLAGRVNDAGGKPISGALVLVSSRENSHGSCTSREDGSFRVDGLAPVAHNVTVSHPDHGNAMVKDVTPRRDDLEIVLGEQEGITLAGTVVDAVSNQPVKDFLVKVDQVPFVPNVDAVMDPARPGRFEVRGLSTERLVRITLTAQGCAPLESEWEKFTPNDRVVERKYTLGATGIVSGRVVVGATRHPVAGITVVLKSASNEVALRFSQMSTSVKTDADGRFVFDDAQTGFHHLSVVPAPPAASITRKFELTQGEREDLGDLEIGGAGATIEVSLIRTGDKTGVPDIPIVLNEFDMGVEKTGTTDATGRCRFENLANGHYLVKCDSHNLSRWIQLSAEETARVELALGGATVRGQVIRAGVPVQASVILHMMDTQETRQGTANAEGRFEFTGVIPGKWTVNARDQGGTFVFTIVNVESDEAHDVALRLPCGEIGGRVVDENDKPIAGAEISLLRVRGDDEPIETFMSRSERAETAADGAFRFVSLPEGRYQVEARKTDLGMDRLEDIALMDGGVEEITLRPGRSQGGTLVSSTINVDTGEPIRDVRFRLFSESGEIQVTVERDAQGIARIENLAAGAYTVIVGGKRYNPSKHEVEIKTGETALVEDELFEAGAFSWRVVGENGKPVGFTCGLEPVDLSAGLKAVDGQSDPGMGFAHMMGIRPGDYRATATLANGTQKTEPVRIAVGETTELHTSISQ